MKLTAVSKSENPALKRTEIVYSVEGTATPPSRKEVREKVAALENAKPGQVIISKIGHGFGSKEVKAEVKIYASVEDAEKAELYYMLGRNKGVKKGKEKAATEAAKAAEGAKAEEKKEAGGEVPAKEAQKEEKKEEAAEAPAKEEKPAKAEEKKEDAGKEKEEGKPGEKKEKKEGEQ